MFREHVSGLNAVRDVYGDGMCFQQAWVRRSRGLYVSELQFRMKGICLYHYLAITLSIWPTIPREYTLPFDAASLALATTSHAV